LLVKTGDAVAITSALQLHSLLATDDEMVGKISPAGPLLYQSAESRSNGAEDYCRVARKRYDQCVYLES
jgi:hypothetical protein